MGLVTAAAVMPPQSPVGHGDLREGIESLLDLMTTTSRLNRSLPAGEMPSLQIAANWQPYEAGMLRAWAAVKQEDVTPRSCVKSDAKAPDLQRRLAPQSQASPVGSPPPSNILAKPDKAKEPCPHPGCSNVFAMVMARVHPDGHSKHYLAHVASCKHAPCANPAVKQEDDCDVVRTPPGNVIVGQHAVVQGATCRLDAPAVSRSIRVLSARVADSAQGRVAELDFGSLLLNPLSQFSDRSIQQKLPRAGPSPQPLLGKRKRAPGEVAEVDFGWTRPDAVITPHTIGRTLTCTEAERYLTDPECALLSRPGRVRRDLATVTDILDAVGLVFKDDCGRRSFSF